MSSTRFLCQRRLLLRRALHGPLLPAGLRFSSTEAAQILEDGGSHDPPPSPRAILGNEGCTEAQIKAVLKCSFPSDRLSSLIAILKKHGSDYPYYSALRRPNLGGSIVRLCQRVRALEESGVSASLLQLRISKPSAFFFMYASPQTVLRQFANLKEIGFSSDEGFLLALRFPTLFNRSIKTRVKPRTNLLYSHGWSDRKVRWMLQKHPMFFHASDASVVDKLRFLEELNIDPKHPNGLRALGMWILYPIPKLHARLDRLSTLGFSNDERLELTRMLPSVLCLSDECLTQKIEFFRHTMKLDLQSLVKYKCILSCSLQKRVIPRFAILQDLLAKGLEGKNVSMQMLLPLTDQEFMVKFNVDTNLLQFYVAQAKLFTIKPHPHQMI